MTMSQGDRGTCTHIEIRDTDGRTAHAPSHTHSYTHSAPRLQKNKKTNRCAGMSTDEYDNVKNKESEEVDRDDGDKTERMCECVAAQRILLYQKTVNQAGCHGARQSTDTISLSS